MPLEEGLLDVYISKRSTQIIVKLTRKPTAEDKKQPGFQVIFIYIFLVKQINGVNLVCRAHYKRIILRKFN